MPSPESELVGRCRAGDESAWLELVDRYSRYVYAISSRGFRLSSQDAEDVFQEVFIRVYEHLGMLRDDAALRSWIGQVTRRLCIDHTRAGHSGEAPREGLEPAAIDERIERLEQKQVVWEAVGKLAVQCRELLDRFFRRDESYDTIASELGIPSGTVASRLSRCLDRLRAELEEGPALAAEGSSP